MAAYIVFLSVSSSNNNSISKGHYKVIIAVIARPISRFIYTDEDIIIIISSEIVLFIYLCVCTIHAPHQSVNNLWFLSPPDLHNAELFYKNLNKSKKKAALSLLPDQNKFPSLTNSVLICNSPKELSYSKVKRASAPQTFQSQHHYRRY